MITIFLLLLLRHERHGEEEGERREKNRGGKSGAGLPAKRDMKKGRREELFESLESLEQMLSVKKAPL